MLNDQLDWILTTMIMIMFTVLFLNFSLIVITVAFLLDVEISFLHVYVQLAKFHQNVIAKTKISIGNYYLSIYQLIMLIPSYPIIHQEC